MGIIKHYDADGAQPAIFGAAPALKAPSSLNVPRVDIDGAPAPEPSPAVEAATPVALAAQAPAPVFEVPGEILQGFYEQVVQAAQEDVRKEATAEVNLLQERYANALDQLVAVADQLRAQNQVQLLQLSTKIAERLVRKVFQVEPSFLMGLVTEVLSGLEDRDEVSVFCGTADHAYLTARREALVAGAGGAFSLKLVLDSALEYGDFRVETRLGSTDGLVTSRLAELADALEAPGAA